MRYRVASLSENIKPDSIPQRAGFKPLNYKLKVITPIYGGGIKAGEPDLEMPIRATAIRGQLRYWWRFLRTNDPVESKRLAGEDLFREERNIWGGMTDDPKKDGSSNVFLLVKNMPAELETKPAKSFTKEGEKYALFPAIQNEEELIEAEIEFQLKITFTKLNDDQIEQVKEAIRWWICFGGLGARTRRGLGSIECTDENFSPLTAEDVSKYGCELKTLAAGSAMDAWNKAVGKLQSFRQGADIGRAHKKDSNGRKLYYDRNNKSPQLGRSFWPEPDSVREITGKEGHPIKHPAKQSFPRAAFGLPIIFEIRGNGEPPKTELSPELSERMASPLILKALPVGGGKYKPIALRLPIDKTVNKLTVTLDYVNLTQEVRNYNEQQQLRRKLPKTFSKWWNNDHARDVIPIKVNNGSDALSAFMNFFSKGGN